MKNTIKNKRLFIFDIDGTISLDNRLFLRTKDVFAKLQAQNKFTYIMTNNSSKLPAAYLENLEKNGLDRGKIRIISSLDIALDGLLADSYKNIYWAANSCVSNYISEKGFIFNDADPQAILLTFDTELNYGKLLKITELINKGVPYFVTHSDFVCPTDKGYPVPDVGSFMELIKITTGKYPDKSFGKPQKYGIDLALRETALNKADTVVIGDRLYTDIKAAENAGVTSILVLSGETTEKMHEESETKADIVLESINELWELI